MKISENCNVNWSEEFLIVHQSVDFDSRARMRKVAGLGVMGWQLYTIRCLHLRKLEVG